MKKILSFFVFVFLFLQMNAQDLSTAKSLFKESKSYAAQGKYHLAIQKMNQAADIFKQKSYKNYLIAKLSVADYYLLMNDFISAEKELVAIEKGIFDAFAENDVRRAVFYSLFGKVEFQKGNYSEALSYFKNAVSIKTKAGLPPQDMANLYSDMANVYKEVGMYDTAEVFYKKSENLIRMKYGQQSVDYLLFLSNMANFYGQTGRIDTAITLEQKVIDIALPFLGENNMIVATAYRNLSQFLKSANRLQEAEEYAMKGLSLTENVYGKSSIEQADQYMILGNIFLAKRDLDNALGYYSAAMTIYEKFYDRSSVRMADIYNNVATVCIENGYYSSAEQYLFEALEIMKKQNLYYTVESGKILSNLALSYESEDNDDKAIDYYYKAIGVFEKSFGKHSNFLVYPYINLANIFWDKGEYMQAMKFYHYSLIANASYFEDMSIFSVPDFNDFSDGIAFLEALNGKAKSYGYLALQDSSSEKVIRTLQFYKIADSAVNYVRHMVFSDEDKIRLGEVTDEIYSQAVALSHFMYRRTLDPKYVSLAFYFIERNKAAVLLQAITDAKAKKIAGIPDYLLKQETFIISKIEFFKRKILTANNFDTEKKYRDSLLIFKQQYEKFVAKLEKEYPDYYKLKFEIPQVKISQLQHIINNNVLILDYLYKEDAIFIILISNKDTRFVKVPLKSDFVQYFDDILNMINKYSAPSEDFQSKSIALYKILFHFEIPKNIKHLVIIPDKILNFLPYEILVKRTCKNCNDFSKFDYMIKYYSFSYSYSAVLYYMNFVNDMITYYERKLVAFAPVFDGKLKRNFMGFTVEPLPGTEKEVRNIDSILAEQKKKYSIFLRYQATEKHFREEVEQNPYQIIHLATHGFINSENPDLSALIFAKGTDSSYDGNLFLGEILNMKIKSDLIVLSACETGYGRIYRGEGVIGLSRAFVYTGIKNLIISLWKVADIPTGEFMTYFYNSIVKSDKEPYLYSEALRQAKLTMLKTKFSHPYFWAPFVLIGK